MNAEPAIAPELVTLGWGTAAQTALRAANLTPEGATSVGRVVRLDRGEVTVALGHRELRAFTPTTGLAVGDWVLVDQRDGADANAVVLGSARRWSTLARRAAGEGLAAQVVAANVDVVLCVHSLTRPLNARRLERELVTAHAAPAAPIVVLNKCDLADGATQKRATKYAHKLAADTPVVAISATSGVGLDALTELILAHPDDPAAPASNPTVVMLGASGVGKSRLLNALTGSSTAAVGTVRDADQKGRHTTTHSSLFPLPSGGVMIDTPGVRALGLWDAAGAIEAAFGDIAKLADTCRFRDCRHTDEPGCAVQDAVLDGSLSIDRLAAFVTLTAELAELDRSRDEQRWNRGEGVRAPRRSRTRAARATHRPDDDGPDDDAREVRDADGIDGDSGPRA